MAANINPLFPVTPVLGLVTISTANTALDGSGAMGTVLTGGTYGTRVSQLTAIAQGATSAGNIRYFVNSGSGGTVLFHESVVGAVTPGAGTACWSGTVTFTNGFVLPNNYKLFAATNNAGTFNIVCEAGNY